MTDPQAFEQLVIRYQGVVCAVAYAVVRDRARSEEIAQEAFLIAWQKLPAMDPPPAMPGWVCGVARNLAANARRRRKEAPMVDVHEPATNSTPLDSMLDAERIDLANRALAELPERDREAVVLYYRGENSVAEIATALGISEPAARQRLHRGREKLASALSSVEAALRATRPGPAFTAACVTAALALPSGDASAAAASGAKAKKWIPMAGAAAIVAGVTGTVIATRGDDSSSTTPAPSIVVAGAIDAGRARTQASGVVIKHLDRAARESLSAKIRGARPDSKQTAPVIGETAANKAKVYDFSGDHLAAMKPQDPPTSKVLDKRSMRWGIREIQPLLLECYTEARGRLAKGGTLEVKMTIVGEPDIGTIVDSVELGGSAHLTGDRDFAECMRETLFSIELPPMPAANETWVVNYPFTMPG